MGEPDYIVVRRAADLPAEFQLGDLDGRWFDTRGMIAAWRPQVDGAVAVPTGRFEVRGDGAVAEVYEIRP